MIAIIDYGMGNIHSVAKAMELEGGKVCITDKIEDVLVCDKIVLPGVGSFSDAITELKKRNLISVILERIKSGTAFLGICLGMQLLFTESEEGQGAPGLGLLRGSVHKFKIKDSKVPHIGWNQIKIRNSKCELLKDIPHGSYVYFCHSYYVEPEDKGIIGAWTDYGIDFVSLIYLDNIFGVQFHPEKSQSIGLKILKNFVDL